MTNPHPSHIPHEPALCQPLRREYLQGATYKALAEKYQIDQRTAKRYVQNNLPLEEYEHRPYFSVLTTYQGLIRKWLKEDHLSSAEIHRRLQAEGCLCSYSLVNRCVQRLLRNAGNTKAFSYTETGTVSTDKTQVNAKIRQSTGTIKPISERIREEKAYVQHKYR